MENEIKIKNIIHPGAGSRAVAAIIDLGIAALVGFGLFTLLSQFVFVPISHSAATVDYAAFDASAAEVMDIQTASGLFYYDDEAETTDIYDELETYQEYDSMIQNYYFVYLQTPGLIDASSAAKYTNYWYNVFIYGLADERDLYSDGEMAARYDIATSTGSTYFEYQVDGAEVKQYDLLASVKASQHVGSDPTAELTDTAASSLLSYFYNGNLYTSSGTASIYVLTIEKDFAYRPFFADVYSAYRDLEYQVYMWSTLLPIITAVFLVSILVYFAMPLIIKNGKTIGKFVMGIGLVNKLGYRLSIPQLVLRFFAPMVLIIGLLIIGGTTFAIGAGLFVLVSYTLVIFTKEHKAIHDYIAGTVAIDTRRSVWFKDAAEEAEYSAKIEAMPRFEIESHSDGDDQNGGK